MAYDYIPILCELKQKEFKESKFPEVCDFITTDTTAVPMRDGIKLETTIYKPVINAFSYPVILQRTCYPMQEPVLRIYGEHLAKRGYAFVFQFSRGQGKSEGKWVPNMNERSDGLDTVEWLTQQPWVDKIGYWGLSYSAMAGWAIADAIKGKVASMCLEHYGTDRFISAYEKGAFRQDVLTSWTMENSGRQIQADYLESCKYMPHIEVDEKLWGTMIEGYRKYITNTRFEDAYWQQGWWKQLREIPEHVSIPLYIISGWYDHHHGSTMKTWERLSPESKEHSWLEVGGWNHFFLPYTQDNIPEHLEIGELDRMLYWFDFTLKKEKIPQSSVRTYIIGSDCWREYSSWENIDRKNKIFYLNQRTLDETLSPVNSSISYQYDPKNPVPTHGAESMLKTVEELGSKLQQEPGYRKDIVSFISNTLTEPLDINGKIQIGLYVKSDCEDTAFTAKIIEITSEGKAYNIRSSITTIEHCLERNKKYHPGEIVKVSIDMWDICYTLPAGSKLRLDISSSDFPQYNIHSNNRGVWSLISDDRTAVQTIYFGPKFPSSVRLPIVSRDSTANVIQDLGI